MIHYITLVDVITPHNCTTNITSSCEPLKCDIGVFVYVGVGGTAQEIYCLGLVRTVSVITYDVIDEYTAGAKHIGCPNKYVNLLVA